MGVKTYYLRIRQPNGITRRVRLNDNDTLKSLSLTTINAFDGTGFTYTNTNNDYTITKYVGTSTSVKSPIKEVVLTPSTIVPNSISYKNDCFSNNKTITDVDLGHIPYVNNRMWGAFSGCDKLTSVTNINSDINNMNSAYYDCYKIVTTPTIPNSVTDISNTFYGCSSLDIVTPIPNSVTNMTRAFAFCSILKNTPEIPGSVTDMLQAFVGCSKLVTSSVIPSSAIILYSTFYGCSNLEGDIYIKSNQVTNAIQCFDGTKEKNVYIPFKYSNGVNSATYNSFISAGYKEDGSYCGVYLKNWTPT